MAGYSWCNSAADDASDRDARKKSERIIFLRGPNHDSGVVDSRQIAESAVGRSDDAGAHGGPSARIWSLGRVSRRRAAHHPGSHARSQSRVCSSCSQISSSSLRRQSADPPSSSTRVSTRSGSRPLQKIHPRRQIFLDRESAASVRFYGTPFPDAMRFA
jgi:hypothetical protein